MENWEKIAKEFFPKEFEGFKRSLSGGRRPDAVSFTDIAGDVKRRDLTINALFYDIDTHEIVDLVGGINDLKNGVVRTVGAAEDRFGEDRLRILRAIRFAGRFGSGLDSNVDAALQKDASLEGISGERIRDEFIKGLKSAKSIPHFLGLINKYNLFNWIFPNLNVSTNIQETKEDYIIILARLLKNNNIEKLRKQLNELKYPDSEIKGILFLIAMLKLNVETAVPLKKLQQNSGIDSEQLKAFGRDENISPQLLNAFINFKFTVNGPEVMAKYEIGPSPRVGELIQSIETDNFKKMLS